MQFCFASPSGHALGVRLAAAAAPMLLDLGLVSECRDWCRRALQVIEPADAGTSVELDPQEAFAVSAVLTRPNGEDVSATPVRGSSSRGRSAVRTTRFDCSAISTPS